MKKVRMVDPGLLGWRYDFPKVCPDSVKNLEEWAVSEGYPRSLLTLAVFRQWYSEVE